MANNNIEDQILAGDKTILDVFADKSKDALYHPLLPNVPNELPPQPAATLFNAPSVS